VIETLPYSREVAYRMFGRAALLNENRFRLRMAGMKTDNTIHGDAEPVFKSQAARILEFRGSPRNRIECDSFFAEPVDPRQEARTLASEVICRLLIWMADGRTLEERGLRACVALYCIRPDLIDGITLEQIGTLAGCSRQAVHKLAGSFRETTGLQV
jgi:hypothetical protein